VADVTNMDGAMALVRQAQQARAVVGTAMNAASSRSHCVFMLKITGWHAATATRLQVRKETLDAPNTLPWGL
jgi:kinesin family protein C1